MVGDQREVKQAQYMIGHGIDNRAVALLGLGEIAGAQLLGGGGEGLLELCHG